MDWMEQADAADDDDDDEQGSRRRPFTLSGSQSHSLLFFPSDCVDGGAAGVVSQGDLNPTSERAHVVRGWRV